MVLDSKFEEFTIPTLIGFVDGDGVEMLLCLIRVLVLHYYATGRLQCCVAIFCLFNLQSIISVPSIFSLRERSDSGRELFLVTRL